MLEVLPDNRADWLIITQGGKYFVFENFSTAVTNSVVTMKVAGVPEENIKLVSKR